jgi:hypothetical protein
MGELFIYNLKMEYIIGNFKFKIFKNNVLKCLFIFYKSMFLKFFLLFSNNFIEF